MIFSVRPPSSMCPGLLQNLPVPSETSGSEVLDSGQSYYKQREKGTSQILKDKYGDHSPLSRVAVFHLAV